MSQATIRQVHGDEMRDILFNLTSHSLHPSPPIRDRTGWDEIVKGRKEVTYIALFEDETAVSIAAAASMTQQVRGALFEMGGIWGVATEPAARRRSYSKRVLTRLLAAVREKGQALSCLYPFRESFYQRLGYVTFPLPVKARFSPSALLPLLKKELNGRVERMLVCDGYDAMRAFLREQRSRSHGMALFDHGNRGEDRLWLALARVDGELVGLMVYRLRGEQVTQFELRAFHFYYASSEGKYLLLEWIARHIDQVERVELWLAPDERPETWLEDLKVSTESAVRAPMGRVIDVARIGGMQTGPGRFSARISDAQCPWNDDVWQFETIDGLLRVSPGEEADCELSIQGLTGLVYGTHDPADFRIREWGEPAAPLQHTMRTMFPALTPHLHEFF